MFHSPSDLEYMRLAFELAERGRGRTNPNPMVGAVVVKDGKVVGRGYHARTGGAHAEVHALREAGAAAQGATLYVTLEPCNHHGRTPPCTEAILTAGVSRVVAAVEDPNPRVRGSGLERLRQAGVEVESGLLAGEARRQNEVFFKYITTGRPFVTLKWAMTLDGKIGTFTGDSCWVTGPAARERVHRLRDEVDAILVGIQTVLKDDPRLTTRLPEGGGQDPIRIVLDAKGRLPETARLLDGESEAPVWLATTGTLAPEKARALARKGVEILELPAERGREDRVSLDALLVHLGRRGVAHLLVEGGGEVHNSFLEAGLADKLYCFVAPKIVGGRQAVSPVGGRGLERMSEAWSLSIDQLERVGDDLLITAYPHRRGAAACSQD